MYNDEASFVKKACTIITETALFVLKEGRHMKKGLQLSPRGGVGSNARD